MRNALLRYCVDGALNPQVDSILARLPALPLMILARVVALQNLRPTDRRVALALYQRVLAHRSASVFRKPHGKLYLDLAFQFSDRPAVKRGLREFKLDPIEHVAMTADMLNPALANGSDESTWLAAVNRFTERETAVRMTLLPQPGRAFDRLNTTRVSPVEGGPKITVALTAWCPDDGLVTAFRSIQNQSWRNLEILVMDDNSPPEFLPLLRSVVASDPRARLVRMPRNGGTYLARNRALDEASGEFFTVHDSDDWAHPERIERQARLLVDSPELVSCSSRALRADDDLVFTLPGVSPSRENASSLMFRRNEVMASIGYYDQSRKGADTEYALRMRQHFGRDSHRTLQEHLALIRLRVGSLSRDEFKPGWRHPSRLTYRLAYQWHHTQRIAAGLPLYVGRDGDGAQRVRPVRFVVDQKCEEVQRRRQWDVMYVLDLRATAEQPPSFLDELVQLVEAGRKVAVMHMESFLYPLVAEVEPYVPELQRLISTGVVGEVLITDDAEVETVVIRDPSSLQFAASMKVAAAANRVLVLPEGTSQGRSVAGWTYSPADVEEHAYRVFGREAVWVMDDIQLGTWRTPLSAARRIIPRNWVIPGTRQLWRAPRPLSDAVRPVRLGRIVLDEQDVEFLSPGLAGLNSAAIECLSLFVSPAVEGVARTIAWSPGWRVEVGTQPEDIYYAQVDVLLLHGAAPRNVAHLRHAMEAAASGCIVIGDEGWDHLLGRMLCCSLGEVPAVLSEIYSSTELEHHYRSATVRQLDGTSSLECFIKTVAPV
ncbi:glycosyltransferase family 2 protein [Luteimonas qiangzhengi]|uniref:glycosyltransferase family 2 protein n=1 Tax=Luteimonas sp. MJ146 TaxID=3129240 RepID=UPI0031BA9013